MASRLNAPSDSAALDVLVEGPEGQALGDADLRRLFPGGSLTGPRLDRLRTWARIVVRFDGLPLGVATYTQVDGETRIPDFGVDVPVSIRQGAPDLDRRALYALLDAVELACLAGGCRRIALVPPRVAAAVLERRGYVGVREGCAGAWMEKALT